MRALINYVLLIAASALGQECDPNSCNSSIFRYYKELKCLPIHQYESCCPSKFNCSHLSRPKNQCHVGGTSYNIGDKVETEQLQRNCAADCFCARTDDHPRAELRCANIECPDMLGVPVPPGCKYIYSHDECCAVGTVCTNETSPAPFKCEHENHSHYVGEVFYPDDTCLKCICQEGYDGTLKEPWCKEIDCGLEVHHGRDMQDGCAPVYLGARGCCPFEWRCPKDTDSVVGTTTGVPSTDKSNFCIFGTLLLKVNEVLNSCTCEECACITPPNISCTKANSTC